MSGDGTILVVPTTFEVGDTEHAVAACFIIAKGPLIERGTPLGYRTVGVLNASGTRASASAVTDN